MYNDAELQRWMALERQKQLLIEAQTSHLLSKQPRVGLRNRLANAVEILALRLLRWAQRLEHHPGKLSTPHIEYTDPTP